MNIHPSIQTELRLVRDLQKGDRVAIDGHIVTIVSVDQPNAGRSPRLVTFIHICWNKSRQAMLSGSDSVHVVLGVKVGA